MFQSIVSAIVAIPKLIQMIQDLLSAFEKIQVEAKLQKIDEAFTKLEAAQTKLEKMQAAHEISSAIHR